MTAQHTQGPVERFKFLMTHGFEPDGEMFVVSNAPVLSPHRLHGAVYVLASEYDALKAQNAELLEALSKFAKIMDSDEDGGEGIFEERLERLMPEVRAALARVRP